MSDTIFLILFALGVMGQIIAPLITGWLIGGTAIKLWHQFTLDEEPKWIGDEYDE